MNTLAVLEGLQPHFLGAFTDGWPDKLILFFVLVASLSVHEWAHAITADKLGDPLPRAEGRVTLNPIAHVDPIGTFLIPLTVLFLSPGFSVFGWGKPVRVSLPNEKNSCSRRPVNYRRRAIFQSMYRLADCMHCRTISRSRRWKCTDR